jgi:hypothetical protein
MIVACHNARKVTQKASIHQRARAYKYRAQHAQHALPPSAIATDPSSFSTCLRTTTMVRLRSHTQHELTIGARPLVASSSAVRSSCLPDQSARGLCGCVINIAHTHPPPNITYYSMAGTGTRMRRDRGAAPVSARSDASIDHASCMNCGDVCVTSRVLRHLHQARMTTPDPASGTCPCT